MFDFQSYSLGMLAAAFAVSAGFVWAAGTRITRYLDRIADRTGMGAGLVGLLLLGGITSLPEVATVSTASYSGNASLAINNVLGSASINVVLLAAADAFLGQRALSSMVGTPTPLLQGVLSIVLLTLVVMGIATTDVAVHGRPARAAGSHLGTHRLPVARHSADVCCRTRSALAGARLRLLIGCSRLECERAQGSTPATM